MGCRKQEAAEGLRLPSLHTQSLARSSSASNSSCSGSNDSGGRRRPASSSSAATTAAPAAAAAAAAAHLQHPLRQRDLCVVAHIAAARVEAHHHLPGRERDGKATRLEQAGGGGGGGAQEEGGMHGSAASRAGGSPGRSRQSRRSCPHALPARAPRVLRKPPQRPPFLACSFNPSARTSANSWRYPLQSYRRGRRSTAPHCRAKGCGGVWGGSRGGGQGRVDDGGSAQPACTPRAPAWCCSPPPPPPHPPTHK